MFLGRVTIAALTLVFLSAGCSGGEALYEATATSNCLEAQGFRVSREDADFFTAAAVNGGYLVDVGPTSVNIAFFRNSHDAADNLKGVEIFGAELGPTLYTTGNALLSWDDTPTRVEKRAVDRCLVEAGSSPEIQATPTVAPTDVPPPASSSPAPTESGIEERTVAHILISITDPNGAIDFKASKVEADRIYSQLKHGAEFGRLAKKNSADSASAARGGREEITSGQTIPEFDKVAFALKIGEISKPVRSAYGWHIIKALGPVRSR